MNIVSFHRGFTFAICFAALAGVSSAQKKKGYTYVVPFDEIPPAPALAPEEALKTFQLHEDFEISVAASDPEVQSPLAIRFDGDGRMWVVEMRGYMLNMEAEGEDEPIGRISILTDTDGDGRIFYNENWFGMKADQLLPNLLRRNPNYPKPFGNAANIAYREKLYPARVTPGVKRGGEGDIDEKGYLKASTASCGPVMYRGDQFPSAWSDTAFFCEPAANLVRVIQIEEKDGLLSGSLPLEEREFLASTDERFRPVNLANAPDGSLFLVDLYHGIVQHKAYLTKYLREHIEHRNLESEPRLGRIYRIKAKERPLGESPKMIGKKAGELVPYLAHENGWWRDTAQQLVIDSGDLSVVPALNAMAADTGKPLGQIHALWTLEGLGAINLEAILAALESEHPHVLEMAVRLGEELPDADKAKLLPALSKVSENSEVVFQRQLAASLGKFPGDESLELLKKILSGSIDQPFFREAAINGLEGREQRFQEILGDDLKDGKFHEYLAESLRPKTNAAAFKLPRDKAHNESFKRGEKLFVMHCMACHGADGMGMEHLGPPLAGSEWVTGSHKRLAAILLQGMQGPISVAGKKYDPAAPMPGLKDNTDLTDGHLADIATFVRFAWNNGKDAVKPETFDQVRGELDDRETTFTADELEQEYP